MDKGTVHRHTAAYPADNPLCILQGVPYTPTLPPILRSSVLARCARCITHNSFLLRFLQLRSSHCPVDSHHYFVLSFHFVGSGGLFHVVFALQRTDMAPHLDFTYSRPCHSRAFLKAFLVQGSWVKINSVFCTWALKVHRLRSELVPPIADTHRRCR